MSTPSDDPQVQPDGPPAVVASRTPVPRWRRALRVGYLVLVLVAFAVALLARRAELAEQLRRLDATSLALSATFAIAGVGVSGLIWQRMMAGLGSSLPWRVAGRVFFTTQLGKYLPGSLWPVLAQAELGRDHHVPVRVSVAAQTLFMWVHLVTGALLGIPVMAVLGLLPTWTAPVALLLVVLLLPGPQSGLLDGVLRRVGRAPLPARPRGRDALVAVGCALLMWVLYGLHVHHAIDALEFHAPGPLPVVAAIGVFAAAWAAGFVVLIAPAGAGARELVLIAGLSMITAPETAFAVTVISRVVLTAADGVWGVVGLLAGRRRSHPSDAEADAAG
jgi:glycosyltransferase 2 family protein